MNRPRIMIAGTQSGVGKTTITLGIMAALSKEGYSVQPFKVGPDYLDQSYHSLVTGNKSINLDVHLTSPQLVQDSFLRYATKDIAVIEGVMGLFDGQEGNSNRGSSAQVAQLLACPIILVIDAKSMARSAAAVAMGFINFQPQLPIAGLIINNLGSDRHRQLVAAAMREVPVPVLGYLKRSETFHLTEGYLGLHPAGEMRDLLNSAGFIELIASQLNLEQLLSIARQAPELPEGDPEQIPAPAQVATGGKVKIAVAKDAAFNFYYWDGLKYLEELGAQLVCFSPLSDRSLPADLGGIIMGGGFPELHLEQLAANQRLQQEIKQAYLDGMPIYAEGGGYLYLCEGIVSSTGQFFPLLKIVPGQAVVGRRLAGMGYRTGHLVSSCVLGEAGTQVTGHQYHYSHLVNLPDNYPWAFQLYNPRKGKWVKEGFAAKNLLASYLHIHWRGSPALAKNFLAQCTKYREKKLENKL